MDAQPQFTPVFGKVPKADNDNAWTRAVRHAIARAEAGLGDKGDDLSGLERLPQADPDATVIIVGGVARQTLEDWNDVLMYERDGSPPIEGMTPRPRAMLAQAAFPLPGNVCLAWKGGSKPPSMNDWTPLRDWRGPKLIAPHPYPAIVGWRAGAKEIAPEKQRVRSLQAAIQIAGEVRGRVLTEDPTDLKLDPDGAEAWLRAHTPEDQEVWLIAQLIEAGMNQNAAQTYVAKHLCKPDGDDPPGTPDGTLSAIPPNLDDRGPELTEDGIALAFAARYRDELRYDHHQRAWFRYDGRAWRKEETQLAFAFARALCRELKRQAVGTATNGELKAMAKAATYAAVETIAKADRAFAVTSTIWDRDPWLLGTPGGTVDLRTGKLRPAKQSDFISKLTAVAPADTADCPLWLKYLNEATRGDTALQRYIQRRDGYCLTGITREHDLMFLWGPGGNGKGILLTTQYLIMGDYAVIAAIDTFVVTHGDKHTTDLAMLHGARLAITTEVDEGRIWDEARLKSMSAGDPITARFMRRDNFTFMPQFKLSVSGNHKPAFKSVDDAIRRRISLVEFLFRPAKDNKQLSEDLKAEWPGILRWMIDGCLEWQRIGLNPPKSVTDATEEYLAEEDAVSLWIDECCIKSGWGSSASLYGSWRAWAEARGERVGTSNGLSKALKKKGFEKADFRTERGFNGLHVRPEAPRWVPD